MKKLAVLIIALGFLSCKKDKEMKSVIPENYSFSAQKNNEKWIGTTSLQPQSTAPDTISFFFVANYPDSEVLVLKIKLNGAGIYPLRPNQAFYYSTIGGDVIASRYFMSPEDTGKLTITKYDPVLKLAEGSFEISLKKHSATPENNVNVLNFTNSSFKVKLLE